MLADSFNTIAVTHRTVGLATHLGANQPNASALDDTSAPLKAVLTVASGMVDIDSLGAARSDADAKNTSSGNEKAPHLTDPITLIAAQAGVGASAGLSVQFANGESVALVSGQDTQFGSGGQIRMHTGQVVGALGGAAKPGESEVGFQIVAAKDAINVQAQADVLQVQARDEVNVVSANVHVDWAAAKSIKFSTSEGANITIEGGNIMLQCPGKIAIYAGKKSFVGPASSTYPLPTFPSSEPVCVDCLIKAVRTGAPLAMVSA
jgi:uncharacterized protein (DUF2345 family)